MFLKPLRVPEDKAGSMAGFQATCRASAEQHRIYTLALGFRSERSCRLQRDPRPAGGRSRLSPRAGPGGKAMPPGCPCAALALDGNVGLLQLWEGSPGGGRGVGTPEHQSACLHTPLHPSPSPHKTSGGLLDTMSRKEMLPCACRCPVPPTTASLPKLDFNHLWK